MSLFLYYTYVGSNINIQKIDYSDLYVYSPRNISEEGEVYDAFNILFGSMWLNEYHDYGRKRK